MSTLHLDVHSRAVLIGLIATMAAACGGLGRTSSGEQVIDGWLVGPATACQDRVIRDENNVEVARGRCEDLVAAATTALDHRDSGHPTVMSMQLHLRLSPPDRIGGLQFVAVYTLADASVRAISVGWPEVATYPFTIDYGP